MKLANAFNTEWNILGSSQYEIEHFPLPFENVSSLNLDHYKLFLTQATFEIEQCWIFAVLWRPFWKWRPVEIFRCRESIQVLIIYLHMKFGWNRTMLNLCGIVAAILKMATGKKFWESRKWVQNKEQESRWVQKHKMIFKCMVMISIKYIYMFLIKLIYIW
jgi:hypothetical protein